MATTSTHARSSVISSCAASAPSCKTRASGSASSSTSRSALDRLNDLLAVAGDRPAPSGLRVDDADDPRLLVRVVDFDHLITLALTEIIRYGSDAPQVGRASCRERV